MLTVTVLAGNLNITPNAKFFKPISSNTGCVIACAAGNGFYFFGAIKDFSSVITKW